MTLTERLITNKELTKEEYITLLHTINQGEEEQIRQEAVRLRKKYYGNTVYVRGLIEFTNYCRNNCYYCGIRAGNSKAERYRLRQEDILECCELGYELGFRTFVLQGGEDVYFTDERMIEIITSIKRKYKECALTLSVGERSYESYKKMKEAGADRYLLRHETADEEHYQILHPKSLSFENRRKCLYELKELGYQVGAGFMVGSPGQTLEHLAEDFVFLKKLAPQMVGIGPFIPHHDTCFAGYDKGSTDKTLLYLSITRILLPKVLLPATTALGTTDANGREKGILAGANVIMPNLSPLSFREKYTLYDNKIGMKDGTKESLDHLFKEIDAIGYELVYDRGDAAF